MDNVQNFKKPLYPALSRLDSGGAVPYSAWSGVVRISDGEYSGSGVLLPSGLHIITAAHLVDELLLSEIRVEFPSGDNTLESFPVQEIILHPLTQVNDLGIWHDLALITLEQSAPPSARRYELYEHEHEIGNTAAIVGYGQGQYPDGTSMEDSRPVMREGLNTVDAAASEFSSAGWEGSLRDQLIFDYDDGTHGNDSIGNFTGQPHLGLGEFEAMITAGDSGGGLFLAEDDQWLLAGIHSYVTGDLPVGAVGDIGASTRISSYTHWIMNETGLQQTVQTMTTDPPSRQSIPMEVAEGEAVNFLVEVPGGASSRSSVEFFTRDGTAGKGQDYIPVSGEIVFEPGDRWAEVWVQTLADSLPEGNEDFELVLTNPRGANFPEGQTELSASRTIVDDVSLAGVTDLSMEIFG